MRMCSANLTVSRMTVHFLVAQEGAWISSPSSCAHKVAHNGFQSIAHMFFRVTQNNLQNRLLNVTLINELPRQKN